MFFGRADSRSTTAWMQEVERHRSQSRTRRILIVWIKTPPKIPPTDAPISAHRLRLMQLIRCVFPVR